MDVSLRTYRELRQAARKTLAEVSTAGYISVYVDGNDEAAEILRLTCLEQNVKIDKKTARVPAIRAVGSEFVITWPDGYRQSS
jgi:hypothetical protein